MVGLCVCVLCAENMYNIVGACSKDGHKFSKDMSQYAKE